MPGELTLLVRVGVGFVLAFVIGFERELRGSPAGDRTFALVGTGTAAITAVTLKASPQAVAGAITGIGFIGAGVVFHGQGHLVRGLTTAAAIFSTAATGVVVGSGRLVLATAAALLTLLTLELRYIPGLGLLDARRYQSRFRSDHDPDEPTGDGGAGSGPNEGRA
jgi:putative Mg2+ transporter-C (MgtC) family protein